MQDMLSILVWQIPGSLIWIIGIVFALWTWRRHPRVSLLILIAFGFQLAQSAFALLVFHLNAPAWFWSLGRSRYFGLISWGMDNLTWALVLIALFLPRGRWSKATVSCEPAV